MNKLNIGIASYEEMKQWSLDVASGRTKPAQDAPKLWFTSLKAAANLFTEENRQLLKIIAEQHPDSIILEAVHETAKGLHAAGVMDQETLREFDLMCLIDTVPTGKRTAS